MNVVAEPYDPALAAAWDEFVRTSRTPHFLFERPYMDYHADRFADASFVVRENDEILAVLPASRHGDTVVSHGGLTFGGLISGHRMTHSRCRAAFEVLVESLGGQSVRAFRYKAIPHIYHLSAAEEDLAVLQEFGAQLTRRDVSAAVAPGLRPQQSSRRRRAIRKGERAGFRVEESHRVEDFMSMLSQVLTERHDTAPVHSAEEMLLLANRFPGRIRLWTADQAGELLSGYLVYETPTVAHAQYIATTASGRTHGAGDLIVQHLLTTVYADRWFDFGTSNERDGSLNAGLMTNKEEFGARTIVYDHYELVL